MPIDGLMLHCLRKELSALVGARVDRVTQPERDEIVLYLFFRKNVRLLLSANASRPRVQLTETPRENPAQAPNFSMLLRKHLVGSKLLGVDQPGLERTLIFRFECRTDLHDIVEKRLIVEIMGRCSNIILTDAEGKIYDSIKQVDFSASSKRQILPGLFYELPPSQGKQLLRKEMAFPWGQKETVESWVTSHIEGLSPLVSRELAYRSTGSCDVSFDQISEEQKTAFWAFWSEICHCAEDQICFPQTVTTDRLRDVYCLDIFQYGHSSQIQRFETLSKALDAFYLERDRTEHLRRTSADLQKLLTVLTGRLSRKISLQQGELEQCAQADVYRLYGDLILSNLFCFQGRETLVRLPDYTSDPVREIEIPLNPSLSPSRNAQLYYKKYKKAQTAKQVLAEQIRLAREELAYTESVRDALARANDGEDIEAIRRELAESGYLKKAAGKRPRKDPPIRWERYRSADGFLILSGRNNLQNDMLTLRVAEKWDLWFHVKNAPGSHTVLLTKGKTPSNLAMTQAAVIAATNSSVSEGKNVAVDYTEIRNVRKPAGTRPGMVVYETYRTAYVNPDRALCENLKF